MKFETAVQKKLSRFLDGPDTLRIEALRPGRRYRSSALALLVWSAGIMRMILSPTALALLPVVLIAGGYASIAMDAPMRVMILLFFAVGAVELLTGFLFRPRLQIKRRLPERVRAGSTFRAAFQVRNLRRRRTAWDLRLDPYSYGPGFTVESAAGIPALEPETAATAESTVTAGRRGRYRIYRSRAESGFPFNLIKWGCSGPREAVELTVYPAFTPLLSVELPVGARSQSAGALNYSRVGDSTDLMGVRDYRDGDDIRRIDWPGSARSGNFVVKEFEEDQIRRVALICDTAVPRPSFWSLRRSRHTYPELEAGLSLTAALTEYFSRGEAVVDIFAVGPEVYHLETGRHTATFDSVCDILASIEPADRPALNQLAPEVFRDLAMTGGALVLLLGDDPVRRAFIEQLRLAGVAVRVILIAEKLPPNPPPEWFATTPATILAGKLREL